MDLLATLTWIITLSGPTVKPFRNSLSQEPVSLEKIRASRWSAIRRLVLLASLVMIHLGWLVEAHLTACDHLVSLSQPLPDRPGFLSYRLPGGLTDTFVDFVSLKAFRQEREQYASSK